MGAVGTFDELLAKARFKEARIKEIGSKWKDSYQPVSVAPRPKTSQSPADSKKPRPPLGRSEVTCYKCGGTGHFARVCPLKGHGLYGGPNGTKSHFLILSPQYNK